MVRDMACCTTTIRDVMWSIREQCIFARRNDEAEMALGTSTEIGMDGCSIGFDFLDELMDCFEGRNI